MMSTTLFLASLLAPPVGAQAAHSTACESGSIVPVDRDSPFMLAAPHGDFDKQTAEIVDAACTKLGWDCLVARGQRTKAHQVNVNRPTEGVKASDERRTACAEAVFSAWKQAAARLNPAPRLYVEVHGNVGKETKERVEVAVVGIGSEQAARIRKVLLDARAEHKLDWMGVWVEGPDPIKYKATSSKAWGQLSLSTSALHFEFPKRAREGQMENVYSFLASSLADISRLEFSTGPEQGKPQ
ncbi:MAG: hypothetical protein HYZ75_05830 [Elusimicrobia bacterium]|nr:hypothetical protein [Elusimicrobiota bacterium]